MKEESKKFMECDCLKCKFKRANIDKESCIFLTKDQHEEYHKIDELRKRLRKAK